MITIESEVADFLIDHGEGLYKDTERNYIEEYISRHILYGTIMIVRKQKKVIAVVRWNWITNSTAKILDLVIHPKFRHKAVLRDMLIQAKMSMPQLTTLCFHKKKLGQNRLFTNEVFDFIGGFHGKR